MKYIRKPEKVELITSWCGTNSSGGVACSKDK